MTRARCPGHCSRTRHAPPGGPSQGALPVEAGRQHCGTRAGRWQKKSRRARVARPMAANAASSAQKSGKAGGRPHHPQAHIVVASVGREVAAIGRARDAPVIVPGPATHHPAGAGWTGSFATLCSVVGIGGIQATGPIPGIPRHVHQSFGGLTTRENTNGRGTAYVGFKGITARCIKVVAKSIAAALYTTRRGLPFCLSRESKRLACLCAQPGTIGPRLEPAYPHHRLGQIVESIVVPVRRLGLTAWRIPCSQQCLELIIAHAGDGFPVVCLFRRDASLLMPLTNAIEIVLQVFPLLPPLLLCPFCRLLPTPPGACLFRLPPALLLIPTGLH